MTEFLDALESSFKISQYAYVGLGSMWFIDFILFHKLLSIDKMFSIERPENCGRAQFNRPLNCIDVLSGETTQVLPTLKWGDNRYLIWLDYDSGVEESKNILEDINTVCSNAQSGSILMVTTNASQERLPKRDDNNEYMNKEKALRHIMGNLITTLPKRVFEKMNFAPFLASIQLAYAKSATIRSGRCERFQPLCNFFYRDGSPMITVVGMIASPSDLELLRTCELDKKFDYIKGEDQYTINVPPLTPKEKIELDRLLPCDSSLSEEDIEKIGFRLQQTQIDAYCRHYKHYPLYAEIAI